MIILADFGAAKWSRKAARSTHWRKTSSCCCSTHKARRGSVLGCSASFPADDSRSLCLADEVSNETFSMTKSFNNWPENWPDSIISTYRSPKITSTPATSSRDICVNTIQTNFNSWCDCAVITHYSWLDNRSDLELLPTGYDDPSWAYGMRVETEVQWFRKVASQVATRLVRCQGDLNKNNILIRERPDAFGERVTLVGKES